MPQWYKEELPSWWHAGESLGESSPIWTYKAPPDRMPLVPAFGSQRPAEGWVLGQSRLHSKTLFQENKQNKTNKQTKQVQRTENSLTEAH